MTSIFVMRWIMVALTAVLAAVLIARGNVVIGGLLAALTVMRIALLARMQQRRDRFRQRAP
jgi:membrane protein implicated in regulation of membrane protease activity